MARGGELHWFNQPRMPRDVESLPFSLLLLQDQAFKSMTQKRSIFFFLVFFSVFTFLYTLFFISHPVHTAFIQRNMSYYCHECAQRREVVYHPLACAVCGSEIIDSVRSNTSNSQSPYSSVVLDTDCQWGKQRRGRIARVLFWDWHVLYVSVIKTWEKVIEHMY